MKLKRSTILVDNVVASVSYTATLEDPCKDHTGDFGDMTEEIYEALTTAFEYRKFGYDLVSIENGDETISLAIVY